LIFFLILIFFFFNFKASFRLTRACHALKILFLQNKLIKRDMGYAKQDANTIAHTIIKNDR